MRVSAFIIIILLASCSVKNNEDYRGFTKRTLTLVDSLGEIELMLPDYYDTLHSWVRMSDHSGGDERYYRFQPAHYNMRQERDYFSGIDSIKQSLTIRHLHRTAYVHPVDSFYCNPYIRREIDTLFQLESDDRQFCYYSCQIKIPYDSTYPFSTWSGGNSRYARADTYFGDLPIVFEFEKLNSDYASVDFNQECLKILRSLKIKGQGIESKKIN